MLWVLTKGWFARVAGALVCGVALVVLVVLGGVGRVAAQEAAAARVLLVGNSYTRFNMMPRTLQRLAESAGVALHVDAVVKAGATLRRHWLTLETRERIKQGGYSFVVIQDHSLRTIDRLPEFNDYATRFVRAATASGATPVLLQTWARSERTRFYRKRQWPQSAEAMVMQIVSAYGTLAAREGARVAPVGQAFSRVLSQSPEIELYRPDGAHPSWAGSYLAACTLFGAITGKDPRDASYVPWELAAEHALRLREIAAQVLARDEPSATLPNVDNAGLAQLCGGLPASHEAGLCDGRVHRDEPSGTVAAP